LTSDKITEGFGQRYFTCRLLIALWKCFVVCFFFLLRKKKRSGKLIKAGKKVYQKVDVGGRQFLKGIASIH